MSYTELLARGKTNGNGKFHFKVKSDSNRMKRSGNYYAKIYYNEEHFEQEENYFINRSDTTINSRIHVPSKAKVEIHLKNFYPTSAEDFFSVSPRFSTYGSNGIPVRQLVDDNSQTRNYHFFGYDDPFDELTITAETAGNQFTYFIITIKCNGERIDRKDSIYIAKGTTGYYEAEFQ